MENIMDYIPVGNESEPVSRESLVMWTGMTDRQVRQEIKLAKAMFPIVNVGTGYYVADDPDDPGLAEYIKRESHRIREISKGLKRHKQLAKVNKAQEGLNV